MYSWEEDLEVVQLNCGPNVGNFSVVLKHHIVYCYYYYFTIITDTILST